MSTLKVSGSTPGALIDPAEINQALIESIVEVDEEVMSRYFEGTLPTEEELPRLFDEAIAHGSLIPVVCVAGKTGVGLKELLDAFALCGLPPNELARTAKDESGKEVPIKPDPAGPLVAQVFKTRIDPFVQKLSYIRVFGGTLKKDDSVHVSGGRKNVKIGPLLEVQGSETHPIDSAGSRRHRGPGEDGRSAHGDVAWDLHDAATEIPDPDGRPGRHAQEPRR